MSIPTTLPRRALTIFFGQSLDTIADLLRGRVTDPALVAYRVVSRGGEWNLGGSRGQPAATWGISLTSAVGVHQH